MRQKINVKNVGIITRTQWMFSGTVTVTVITRTNPLTNPLTIVHSIITQDCGVMVETCNSLVNVVTFVQTMSIGVILMILNTRYIDGSMIYSHRIAELGCCLAMKNQ